MRSGELTALHPAIFRFPGRDCVRMNAVLTAEVDERYAGVLLFENRDNMRLGEAKRPHGTSVRPRDRKPRSQTAEFTEATSIARKL